uniref:Uncharacterized protein n=1 Tax=Acrobeloides nanus TaxID=290746 RepID=A0A914C271_9BILA
MANRNVNLSQELRDEIYKETSYRKIDIIQLDLNSLASIKPSAPLDEKLNKLIPNPSEDIGMMDALRLYSISKLCNVLFALKVNRLEHENGINTYVLHPGVIPTTSLGRSAPILSSIFAFVSKPFTKNFEQGAATTVYCAASPFVENIDTAAQ